MRIGVMGADEMVMAAAVVVALGVRATARGISSICVDGAPFAGGLDVVAGVETAAGVRWKDLARVRGRVDGLPSRLPTVAGCPILSHAADSWSVSESARRDVVDSLGHEHELVVANLDPAWCGVWFSELDEVVVVGRPDATGVAALAALAQWWPPDLVLPQLWMRHGPGADGVRLHVSERWGWGRGRLLGGERRLRAGLRRGSPPGVGGRLTSLADGYLDDLCPIPAAA